jgi:hypothetical protein
MMNGDGMAKRKALTMKLELMITHLLCIMDEFGSKAIGYAWRRRVGGHGIV